MLELDHLTVSGDVTFGKNVSLKVCGYDENYSSYSFTRQVSFSSPKFTFKEYFLGCTRLFIRYAF